MSCRLSPVAMRQTWRRLTFLHWPYDPDLIRRFIPAGLELDTFDNAAWVGLVPFEIYDLPGIPHFPETNLRTYVIGPDGSRAVWFFSLEAARAGRRVGGAHRVSPAVLLGEACASLRKMA